MPPSTSTENLLRELAPQVLDAMSRTALGPYQLQAAIAAVHAEAARAEDTDWPQILALYELLEPLSSISCSSRASSARSPRW